jgi:hypothetical protein
VARSRSAAEEVAETDVETLASLVDKNLVVRAGRDRLCLLATIHEFLLARLTKRRAAQLARRHAAFYRRLLPDAHTTDHAHASAVYRRGSPELDNVRAAVEWVLEHAEPDTALDYVSCAAALWDHRGLDAEAEAWLSRALSRAVDATPARVDALVWITGVAIFPASGVAPSGSVMPQWQLLVISPATLIGSSTPSFGVLAPGLKTAILKEPASGSRRRSRCDLDGDSSSTTTARSRSQPETWSGPRSSSTRRLHGPPRWSR